MRGKDEVRVQRLAPQLAEDVADLVDAHVLQPDLLEHPLQFLPADLFLEGGRGNLAEANLILDGLWLVRLHGVERRLHRRVFRQVRQGRRLGQRHTNARKRENAQAAKASHQGLPREPPFRPYHALSSTVLHGSAGGVTTAQSKSPYVVASNSGRPNF
jgi:hypothetical protein